MVAPSAPAGLSVGDITTNSFTLFWTAASDNVGVSGYNIYSNGTLIGSSTGTSFKVTGLAPSSAYGITVRAKDAAGNLSAASTSLQVTTITDVDGNGISDAWEMAYFGGIGVDPQADSDGDGLTNAQDYLVGRNPSVTSVQDSNQAVGLQVYSPTR
jgi:hypothetical protein